jgi:hypothetical protein
VKEEFCEQLISAAEQFAQTLGGDLYEVMKKAPQVVEKWRNHYFLAHEIWHHASTRESLRAFLLSVPDPEPAELAQWLSFVRTLPFIMRKDLQTAAKNLPPSPGGRPRELTPSECRDICAEIGQLYGQGVSVRDAQKRMAQRYNKGLRTIQRAWQERRQWKSHTF